MVAAFHRICSPVILMLSSVLPTKPINSSVSGVIAHEVDELRIASIVTAIQDFLGKKLVGVLDALSPSGISFRKRSCPKTEIRVAADIAFFLKNDDLLNALHHAPRWQQTCPLHQHPR